jgi:hypothetical protein
MIMLGTNAAQFIQPWWQQNYRATGTCARPGVCASEGDCLCSCRLGGGVGWGLTLGHRSLTCE